MSGSSSVRMLAMPPGLYCGFIDLATSMMSTTWLPA